jgi:hypothetical protein
MRAVLVSALRSRRDLVLESPALGQQLATLASRQRPRSGPPTEPSGSLFAASGRSGRTCSSSSIHGELLRLGIDVSERSVSRYLRSLPRPPRSGQTWSTFLKNHRHGIGLPLRQGSRNAAPPPFRGPRVRRLTPPRSGRRSRIGSAGRGAGRWTGRRGGWASRGSAASRGTARSAGRRPSRPFR